jgi:regulatory protein
MPSTTAASPPDAASLHEAALVYLARFAATEAGLRRVLTRQVDRWARAQADPEAAKPMAAAARQAIEAVLAALVKAGAISDVAYAQTRARTLVRGGQSNRAVRARLIAKGVAPEIAVAASVNDPGNELAAALVLVRKRRIGPYRPAGDPATPSAILGVANVGVASAAFTGSGFVPAESARKDLGLLARAGFSRDIAEQALSMTYEEAENRISALRRQA